MDNSEAIGGESRANAGAHCPGCGLELISGARFCSRCGARVHHPTSASGTADVTLLVVGATLGWLFLTLLFAAQPLSGVVDGVWASVRASAMHVGFLLGLMTPLIVLLALVVYRSWKAGGRVRFSQPRLTRKTPGSGVVVLVALTWLLVSLLLRSEPGSDFTAGILWLILTGCLALAWLGILVPNAYRTWKACGFTKAATVVSYLIPLPLAAMVLFVVIPGQAPLKTRFELSEAALSRYIDQFEGTGGESSSGSQFVGLYKVVWAYRRDGCVILRTHDGLDYEAGIAYCTGRLPTKPSIDLNHLKGRWWIYANHH